MLALPPGVGSLGTCFHLSPPAFTYCANTHEEGADGPQAQSWALGTQHTQNGGASAPGAARAMVGAQAELQVEAERGPASREGMQGRVF